MLEAVIFFPYFFFFALGAIIGSFVLVVAERLHTGASWVSGKSRCDSCSYDLAPRDLVPIFSWLINRGRCRNCASLLSPRYIGAEVALGALFVLSYAYLGLTVRLPFLLLSMALILAIVIYDFRHTIIPLQFSLLLIASSLIYVILGYPDAAALGLTLLVAGTIGLAFFLFWFVSLGKLMGLGDAPVAFALSLLLGGSAALSGLIFSFWIGAVIGIAILLRLPPGRRMGVEVPFAPFLAAGFLLALFTGWNPLYLFVF